MSKWMILASLLVLLLFVHSTNATTIVVPDDFSNIGDAINNAKAGDTIVIRSGIYSSSKNVTITIDKPLTIMGLGNVTIDATGYFYGFRVSNTQNVIVKGLKFKGGNGIEIQKDSFNITVRNCHFENVRHGVYLGTGNFRNITIEDCYINMNNGEEEGIHKYWDSIVK